MNRYKSFNEWLSYQIRLSGHTQNQFSLHVGVSENTVSLWCTGKVVPNFRNFLNICKEIWRHQINQRSFSEIKEEGELLL